MKTVVSFGFLLVVALCVVAADAKVDFTGTWAINTEKSQLGEGGRWGMNSPKLVVTQDSEAITYVRTIQGRDGSERTNEVKLTLDGKATKSETQRGERMSAATWEGETLIITSTTKMEREGETFEIKSVEKWSISEGGKILNIDFTSQSPRGDRSGKVVYDKK